MNSALTDVHPDGTVFGKVDDAEVPLRYSTLETEYEAVRERAAVIDLSPVSLIEVRGDAAVDFVQRILARDVEYLTAERCMSSLVLAADGRIVDQVVVWGREDGMILESSCGAGSRLLAYLESQDHDGVEIVDRSDDLALVAFEGPYCWGVIGRLIDGELAALPLESVADTTWDGVDVVFGRTGSTGEYGYKIIVPRADAAKLWSLAVEHATPVGLEALELAMMEVRQPVLRHEDGHQASVLELGANWLVDFTKESFVGRDALLREFEGTPGVRTVGFRCGSALPAAGTRVLAAGEEIGQVVYATHSIGIGETLGLARVAPEFAAAGLHLTVGDAEAVTLSSPYVTPKSWSIPVL
ncbi:glycine cleavage T C-terminal barrel domain-containing protein [Solwaraspora sp. WMMD406]|uniref:aminomethyltransferase family protein n=1 Tax=Solwaraspora sp. WMMD406 TaxID=3016095 RepID=UPI002416A279|nr:glycine cleavage T C-terminal barrel domain-containing protein [Solwaraspora sp. WMMD406]MDG4765620.1 glycine cleavage T C-terminal barrel domain-containing protein [Solwaraspora sp. WMMD406]